MLDFKSIYRSISNGKGTYLTILGIFAKAIFNFLGLAVLLALLLSLISEQKYDDHLPLIALAGVTFLILKNFIVLSIDRAISKFLLSVYRIFSKQMLVHYYRKGLQGIKQHGTTGCTRDVNHICFSFVIGVLNPLLRIAGEGILLVLMFVALTIYSYKISLLLLLLLLPLLLLYLFVINKRVAKYGKLSNEAKYRQWKTVDEIFKGYIEIRINQSYGFFYRRFDSELQTISRNHVNTDTFSKIPNSLIEIGMATLLFFVVLVFDNKQELSVFLGIFAVTAFKVLPSVTSIISSWLQLKNNIYTLPIIQSIDDAEFPASVQQEIVFSSTIEVDNLSYTYSDSNKPTIEGLSFNIARGETLGIRGVSGGGKTTLMNILQGFLRPTGGRVLVDSQVLSENVLDSWHKQIAYVPQDVFIMEGTVAENIALNDSDLDIARMSHIIGELGLDRWLLRLPQGFDTPISHAIMSGGERQRIGLARALYKQANLIFLDEVTSAVDIETEREILDLIVALTQRDKSLTIIMISHREGPMSICTRVIEI